MRSLGLRAALVWTVAVAVPWSASGQQPAVGASAVDMADHVMAPSGAFAGARSGTSRQPLSVEMEGVHAQVGSWSVMAHGALAIASRWGAEPRGDKQAFFTNHVTISGRRAVGPGWLEIRGMASAEPAMGARGYSLLLQTGETADGVNPLVDRQHPHDAIMELSAYYQQELEPGVWAFFYAAPVGSPALGPVPFMHRASGSDNPVAPISHHFLDATHIAPGVVTAGLFVDERIQFELSVFNGHEPDQDRWLPKVPSLNSASGRLTFTPGGQWAFQASIGRLSEPEQLHPAIDFYRFTMSASHHRAFARGAWSTTAAWGRNNRQRTTMTLGEARARLPAPLLNHYLSLSSLPPGADDSLMLLFEGRVQSSVLLESSFRWRGTSAFARLEWATKDELFPATDLRHSTPFRVAKWDAGVVRDFSVGGVMDLGIGASVSVHSVADALSAEYGRQPVSLLVFTRARL